MSDEIQAELGRLFRDNRVVDLDRLKKRFVGRSDRSVSRDLKEAQAISSYSHAGKYYTMKVIARFDDRGLWHYKDIGFSRYGTLKATIEHWVKKSGVGYTYQELKDYFVVRIGNVLGELVADKRIIREGSARGYMYFSTEEDCAALQRMKRQEQSRVESAPLGEALVIEILAEVIRECHVCVDIRILHERLEARGIAVSMRQVAMVLERYQVKKTLGSR